MGELTDYLRSMSEVAGDTFEQAADEIERLRAALDQIAMWQCIAPEDQRGTVNVAREALEQEQDGE